MVDAEAIRRVDALRRAAKFAKACWQAGWALDAAGRDHRDDAAVEELDRSTSPDGRALPRMGPYPLLEPQAESAVPGRSIGGASYPLVGVVRMPLLYEAYLRRDPPDGCWLIPGHHTRDNNSPARLAARLVVHAVPSGPTRSARPMRSSERTAS